MLLKGLLGAVEGGVVKVKIVEFRVRVYSFELLGFRFLRAKPYALNPKPDT